LKKKQIIMKNFNQKFNLRKVTLALLITLAACQQNEEPTKVAKTKEELIGTSFKADLALIEKATLEVDQLKYQLPQNRGKALNEISFTEYQETIINRLVPEKGKQVVKVYDELVNSSAYERLISAQSKALSIFKSQMADARTASDVDLNSILNPFNSELNNSEISEKSKRYIRSLKDALVSTLNEHLQKLDKAATIVNGEKVIENYDHKALSFGFQAKISSVELDIIADGNVQTSEKQLLLLATSQAYEKANLISNLFENTSTSSGRIQWSWRSFFKVVAVAVAVAVIVVVAPIAAAAIAPSLVGSGVATTVGGIVGSIAGTSALTITAAGVAVAALTSIATSYIAGQVYCASVSWDCNNDCSNTYSLYNSVKKCPFWD
jgi:hypothetical protein